MWNRQEHRQAIIKCNDIHNASKRYHFFYDETNNIAKLRLKNGRLNISNPQCFALGGLVTPYRATLSDLPFFLSLLSLQSNVPELKREYLGKGEFLGILDRQRTSDFLDWYAAQDYFLHYQIVDPLYWGMVDIIDNIMVNAEFTPQLFVLRQGAKADLHRVIQHALPETERIFSQFDYPNVEPKKQNSFFLELINMVVSSQAIPEMNQQMLKGLLQMGIKQEDMPFFGGEEAATLLDSFDKFYAERIMLFENSIHIFDEESNIQEKLESPAYQKMRNPQTMYKFVNSKSEIGVQISDLIIGLIGKYFSFLNDMRDEHLLPVLSGLSSAQLHNLQNLKKIINRSDTESNAFFHHVMSAYLANKQRRVLTFLN